MPLWQTRSTQSLLKVHCALAGKPAGSSEHAHAPANEAAAKMQINLMSLVPLTSPPRNR